MRDIPFFNGVSDESIVEKLIPRMKMQWFSENTSVFEEGWSGSEFYIIVAGCVKATISLPQEEGAMQVVELGRLGRSDFFGEIALLENKPRGATITACTDCVLLSLSKEDLEIISQSEATLHQTMHSMLTVRSPKALRNLNLAYFAGFTDEQFQAISKTAKLTSYSKDALIFRISEMGQKFFILIEGEVNIVGKDGKIIKTIQKRQAFSEMSLVKVAPLTADAIVTTDTAVCVEIGHDDFKELVKFENEEERARCHLLILGRRADLMTLLAHKLAFDSFKKHCEKEFSVENVHFWAAVRRFDDANTNKENDREKLHQLFKEIYDEYICEGSPSQINIPSKMQKALKSFLVIDNNAELPDLAGVFEKADAEIFKLMERDSLPTFKWSTPFKELLTQISPFRGMDLSASPNSPGPNVVGDRKKRTARKSISAQSLVPKKQNMAREAVSTSFMRQSSFDSKDDTYNY